MRARPSPPAAIRGWRTWGGAILVPVAALLLTGCEFHIVEDEADEPSVNSTDKTEDMSKGKKPHGSTDSDGKDGPEGKDGPDGKDRPDAAPTNNGEDAGSNTKVCPAEAKLSVQQTSSYKCTEPELIDGPGGLKCPTTCCSCADGKAFRAGGYEGSRCLSADEACLCGKGRLNGVLDKLNDPNNKHCG